MVRNRARSSSASKSKTFPAVRQPTPFYCSLDLQTRLKEFVVNKGATRALDLGEYMNVPTSHAVRGSALVKLKDLVMLLAGVSSTGLILYKDLKSVTHFLGVNYPGMKAISYASVDEWATRVSQQLVTVLNHTRRLQDICSY